ncbi:hypothetical protein SAMN06297387_102218 [Streptomyces zhaozhouensis]|uniref:Uncharacterized protein n=1 Tax=Streptomyces zhaozhouensis TaxID=1300267 RepID=A0A286DPW8_9ACTN|nr:hypothetical protein SAMN06297387_102218 [Streptomyces zhaozhouensis]
MYTDAAGAVERADGEQAAISQVDASLPLGFLGTEDAPRQGTSLRTLTEAAHLLAPLRWHAAVELGVEDELGFDEDSLLSTLCTGVFRRRQVSDGSSCPDGECDAGVPSSSAPAALRPTHRRYGYTNGSVDRRTDSWTARVLGPAV